MESNLFILLCLGIAVTIFWVWMLADCLIHEPREQIQDVIEKAIWVFVILLGHFLGALLYYFIRKLRRNKIFTPVS